MLTKTVAYNSQNYAGTLGSGLSYSVSPSSYNQLYLGCVLAEYANISLCYYYYYYQFCQKTRVAQKASLYEVLPG